MSRSRRFSALLVVFCAMLSACGGDDDTTADPQPTTTSPSTTQSPAEADEAALRQLAEDWYQFVTNVYRGTADPAGASDFVTEPYLGQFEASAADHLADGNTSDESSDSSHEVRSVEVAAESATVVECIIDADVLKGPDGEVLNDSVVAQLVSTSASQTDAGWRFNERELISEREGENQCVD